MSSNQTIVAVGDTHFPFADRSVLREVLKAINTIQPDIVVQVGDLYDLYSFGKFPRSHNILTPKEEVMLGRKEAEDFWASIRQSVPHAEKYQLIGNHDERPIKRVSEKCPEIEALLDIRALWKFDGVTTMPSEREELLLNNICFMHGYRKFGTHCTHNRMNTVTGHLHRGGVHYERLGDDIIWELNAGFVGDPTSGPLSYTKQRRFSNWTTGYALIDALGPRFVPVVA